MSRVNGLLLAICLNGVACGVAAQDAYLVGGLGSTDWIIHRCGANGCDRSTSSWRVAAGYRFNRIVAVEGSYLHFGCARSSSGSLLSFDGELCGTALGVQALLGYQFGAVDFAGKVGRAEVRSDFRPSATSRDRATTSRTTEPNIGLMGAYRFTPKLALRLDLDTFPPHLFFAGPFQTITLGLMVRF